MKSTRRRFLGTLGGFAAGVALAPSEAVAAGSLVRVWVVIRPYSAPDKQGPPPIPCGGKAPSRLLCEVWAETTGPLIAPLTFEFGQIGAARDGGDLVGWIQETRRVALEAGITQVALIDQMRIGAGEFYFHARIGDQSSEQCSFIWT